MSKTDHPNDNKVSVYTHDFFQLRALCDEIMGNLCQAKALLEPINDDDFFQRMQTEVLRHYFYALDTIIDCALETRDQICHVIDGWEGQHKKSAGGCKEED